MTFSPPATLSGVALVGWEAIAIISFYSLGSMFGVPHFALGAELTLGCAATERNRAFGYRHVCSIIGQFLGIVAMYFVLTAQVRGPAAVRSLAASITLTVGASLICIVFGSVATLRERQTLAVHKGAGFRICRSFSGVLTNRHARILSLVYFIEEGGKSSFSLMAVYYIQYVLEVDPSVASLVMVAYMICSMCSVPGWLRVARSLGKKRTWLVGA